MRINFVVAMASGEDDVKVEAYSATLEDFRRAFPEDAGYGNGELMWEFIEGGTFQEAFPPFMMDFMVSVDHMPDGLIRVVVTGSAPPSSTPTSDSGNEWEALAEALLAQDEPEEALVDKLVGEGLTAAPQQAQAAVCRLLTSPNTELGYALCHALLDFEIPITAEIAHAAETLLEQPSRRIFMAALYVILRQPERRGVPLWEARREHVSEEWRRIGDGIMQRTILPTT